MKRPPLTQGLLELQRPSTPDPPISKHSFSDLWNQVPPLPRSHLERYEADFDVSQGFLGPNESEVPLGAFYR